jgi:hypothetical protein
VQVIGAAITRRLQARAHHGAAWCRSLAADVRALQIEALNQSVQAHMAGPAMHYADPLTESLFSQLEGPAEEGAQAPSHTNAGLTPAQRAALADADNDDWLLWLAPAGFAVGLIASAALTWGRA